MREEGDADGLAGLGLLLALSALVEKWAGAAMLGYEVAMGMPLAPRPGGHGFDGHEFFVVSAWPFVNASYIHQEVQVDIEGQVSWPISDQVLMLSMFPSRSRATNVPAGKYRSHFSFWIRRNSLSPNLHRVPTSLRLASVLAAKALGTKQTVTEENELLLSASGIGSMDNIWCTMSA